MWPQDAGQQPSFRLAPASTELRCGLGSQKKATGRPGARGFIICPSREGLRRPGRLGDPFACGWSGAGRGQHSCSQQCVLKPSSGCGLCRAQVGSGHTAGQPTGAPGITEGCGGGAGGRFRCSPRFGAGCRKLPGGRDALWAQTQRPSLGSSWLREGAGRGHPATHRHRRLGQLEGSPLGSSEGGAWKWH